MHHAHNFLKKSANAKIIHAEIQNKAIYAKKNKKRYKQYKNVL